jgi:RAB protein geranylgeranyltransferase component A
MFTQFGILIFFCLFKKGMKVLHIDRNGFYGGEGASVNLTNLWKIFRKGQEYPKQLGANRDWNIDLVPKFIMANGKLVKILLKTRVAGYLEWKCKHPQRYFIYVYPNSNIIIIFKLNRHRWNLCVLKQKSRNFLIWWPKNRKSPR